MPSITINTTTRITYVVKAPDFFIRGKGAEVPKITDKERLPKLVDHFQKWER